VLQLRLDFQLDMLAGVARACAERIPALNDKAGLITVKGKTVVKALLN